jgi:hypothetical protein
VQFGTAPGTEARSTFTTNKGETMTTNNRTHTQGTDQQVIQGIEKDLQTMPALPLGGTAYTPGSLVAFVQRRIDAANGVITAKANWHNAVVTYEALNLKADEVIRDLKALVIGAFGSASPKLADFGFTPRKVTVRTPEQKAAAAAKAKATRKARNTMGPKAKLAVKGTVAPPTAPSAAAPPSPTPPAPSPANTPAPATAPTVTVNVTTAPGPSPVASPATASAPAQTQNGAAVPEAPANASAKS